MTRDQLRDLSIDDRHERGCVRRYGAVPDPWVEHEDCACHSENLRYQALSDDWNRQQDELQMYRKLERDWITLRNRVFLAAGS